MYGIDFETYLIGEKQGFFPKPVCLSVYDGHTTALYTGSEMGPALFKILNSITEVVAHNAVFECGVIYKHFPELRAALFSKLKHGEFYCTKMAEEILNQTRETPKNKLSLADLCLEYFNIDLSEEKSDPDAWRLRYSELDGVPKKDWPKEAVDYALNDAVYCYDLRQIQGPMNKRMSVDLQSAVYLNIVGDQGLTIDVDRVAILENELETKLNPLYDFLLNKGFCTKNKNKMVKNMKKFREYILDNIDNPIYTSKGIVKTGQEALEGYYNQNQDEIIGKFLEMADYEKALTAFVRNLKHPLIRSRYSTTKSTGRTSCSGDRNLPSVNMQQMPRQLIGFSWDIRNCFIPSRG